MNDKNEPTGRAKGAKARAESLTPEERSAIAKQAAQARWATKPSQAIVSTTNSPAPAENSLPYVTESGASISLRFDGSNQGVWATLEQISNLFGRDKSVISRHLKNIFETEELDRDSVVAKIATTAADGKTYQVDHYNLDAIISVGYRVNSKVATVFRQWATKVLKAYLEQGYVINEKALRESPEKLNKLAAQIRALRSEEKQVYAKVRECFKISASDYDGSSQQVRSFYALLQDKFHHAVTGMTSSKLVLDRANHIHDKMGLVSMTGDFPTLADAQTGKNYLKPDELYRLHMLSEQFLLFAESTALAGKKMTMESLRNQLDRLLTLNDYPVFEGYTSYIKDEALHHAKIELGLYKKRRKIESLGIEYDEESLAAGEYDEILIDFTEQ